jgi:TonB family protein
MTLGIALWLALLAPQATTAPTTAPEPSKALPTQRTSPSQTPAATAVPAKPCNFEAVTSPRVTYQVEPFFAKDEPKPTFSANTVVQIVLSTQGIPETAHVLRSAANKVKPQQRADALILDQKALDAVKQYRFVPATCNGAPMAAEVNIEVHFSRGKL